MSKRLHIDKKWQKLFAEIGLKSYEDFFNENAHFELVASEKSQNIFKIKADGNIFYLKRNTPERPRKIFRQLLRFRPYIQPITKEIRNLIHLNNHSINVMKMAAWGIETAGPMPKTSFLVAENVEGIEFIDFYKEADSSQRKILFKEYAGLVASLHLSNLDSIARIQDILCKIDGKSLTLTLIDREEGSTLKTVYNENSAALELAKIFYHGVKRYKEVPTPKEIMIFCHKYLEVNKKINIPPKEFYRILVKKSIDYMQKRKSFKEVRAVLPDTLFN